MTPKFEAQMVGRIIWPLVGGSQFRGETVLGAK